jgi:hypothetical protein
MSYDPYANLPPAAAFSLTSSDLRQGEKLAMPQVIPVGVGPCQPVCGRAFWSGIAWAGVTGWGRGSRFERSSTA